MAEPTMMKAPGPEPRGGGTVRLGDAPGRRATMRSGTTCDIIDDLRAGVRRLCEVAR